MTLLRLEIELSELEALERLERLEKLEGLVTSWVRELELEPDSLEALVLVDALEGVEALETSDTLETLETLDAVLALDPVTSDLVERLETLDWLWAVLALEAVPRVWLEAELPVLALDPELTLDPELALTVLALDPVDWLEPVVAVLTELGLDPVDWSDRLETELAERALDGLETLEGLERLPELDSLEALEGLARLALETELPLLRLWVEALEPEPTGTAVTLEPLDLDWLDALEAVLAFEVALEPVLRVWSVWLDPDWFETELKEPELVFELAVLNVTSDWLDRLDWLVRLETLEAVLALEAVLQLLTLDVLTSDTLDGEYELGEESVLRDAMGYIAGLEGRIPVTRKWQSIACWPLLPELAA